MANDTYDLDGRGPHRLNPETFTNNILAAESMPSEIFVELSPAHRLRDPAH